MPLVAHHNSFYDLQARYFEGLPSGSAAFYAQVFPEVYPGDEPFVDALRANPNASPLVDEHFIAIAERLQQSGILLQRLMVVRGPGEEQFDAGYLRVLQASELQQRGLEGTRVAFFGSQLLRLSNACGENSNLLRRYCNGVELGVPQASFWGSYLPEENTPQTIGMMNYHVGGQGIEFSGVSVWQAPYPPDIARYTKFWREEVFADSEQFVPLAKLRLDE